MNSLQIQTLTTMTINDLVKGATEEAMAWINQGRIITNFIETIRNNAHASIDPYKILSSSPDCPYGTVQLRNYVNVYRLYSNVNVNLKNLTMTHFIVVCNEILTNNDKENLLNEASEKEMTISQFRERVYKFIAKYKGEDKIRTIQNPSNLSIAFEKNYQKFFKYLVANHAKDHKACSSAIQRIVRFALKNGYEMNEIS